MNKFQPSPVYKLPGRIRGSRKEFYQVDFKAKKFTRPAIQRYFNKFSQKLAEQYPDGTFMVTFAFSSGLYRSGTRAQAGEDAILWEPNPEYDLDEDAMGDIVGLIVNYEFENDQQILN